MLIGPHHAEAQADVGKRLADRTACGKQTTYSAFREPTTAKADAVSKAPKRKRPPNLRTRMSCTSLTINGRSKSGSKPGAMSIRCVCWLKPGRRSSWPRRANLETRSRAPRSNEKPAQVFADFPLFRGAVAASRKRLPKCVSKNSVTSALASKLSAR